MKQQNRALLIEAVPIAVILIHEKVTRNNNGAGTSQALYLVNIVMLIGMNGRIVGRVNADLFIVLFECGQVLACLGKFALFHALANVPVNEGTFRVHQIELVVKSRPGFGNRRRIGQHAHGTLDFGAVATRNHSRRLVVDADLETSRAPVDELNALLRLDHGDGGIDVLGDDIATPQ